MAKTKLSHTNFVTNVRKRLGTGLAKYGDAVHINGNMGAASVFAEVQPTFGISVKLCVEADLLRDPSDAAVKTSVAVSGTHHSMGNALLLASIIEDVARLGLLIEASLSDTSVFFADKT